MPHGAHATESLAVLVKDAILHRATDIHISYRADVFEVRYCIDGLVTKQSRFANDDLSAMSKALEGYLEGPGHKDPGQSAYGVVMISQPDGESIKARIARIPCFPSGYDLIAKIFRTGKIIKTDVRELGYTQKHMEELLCQVETIFEGEGRAGTLRPE